MLSHYVKWLAIKVDITFQSLISVYRHTHVRSLPHTHVHPQVCKHSYLHACMHTSHTRYVYINIHKTTLFEKIVQMLLIEHLSNMYETLGLISSIMKM